MAQRCIARKQTEEKDMCPYACRNWNDCGCILMQKPVMCGAADVRTTVMLTINKFSDGTRFFTGNRCERGAGKVKSGGS